MLPADLQPWAWTALALSLLAATPLHALDAQEPVGRLSLAAVPDPVEVDGARSLNGHLREGLRVRSEGEALDGAEVVLVGVIASADGEIVSRCVSRPTILGSGGLPAFESRCGRSALVSEERLAEGPIELGEPRILRGEEPGCVPGARECGAEDLVSGAALGELAVRMAGEWDGPVLVIGAVPADPERASGVLVDLVAYPCGLPF